MCLIMKCSFTHTQLTVDYRSPGEGNGNPLQDSCLGNPMDRGAWWLTVHGFRHNLVKSDCKVWNNVSEQLLE